MTFEANSTHQNMDKVIDLKVGHVAKAACLSSVPGQIDLANKVNSIR